MGNAWKPVSQHKVRHSDQGCPDQIVGPTTSFERRSVAGICGHLQPARYRVTPTFSISAWEKPVECDHDSA